jgi:hypothetical protein
MSRTRSCKNFSVAPQRACCRTFIVVWVTHSYFSVCHFRRHSTSKVSVVARVEQQNGTESFCCALYIQSTLAQLLFSFDRGTTLVSQPHPCLIMALLWFRMLLDKFNLTGETQERERILVPFSKRYYDCNTPDYGTAGEVPRSCFYPYVFQGSK